MNKHMSTEVNDLMADGVSDCCSAKVTDWGMCVECKEHCAIVKPNARMETIQMQIVRNAVAVFTAMNDEQRREMNAKFHKEREANGYKDTPEGIGLFIGALEDMCEKPEDVEAILVYGFCLGYRN